MQLMKWTALKHEVDIRTFLLMYIKLGKKSLNCVYISMMQKSPYTWDTRDDKLSCVIGYLALLRLAHPFYSVDHINFM